MRVNPSFVLNMSKHRKFRHEIMKSPGQINQCVLGGSQESRVSYSSITPVTEEVGAVSSYRGLATVTEVKHQVGCSKPSEWIFMSTATVIQPATMGLSPPEVWIFGKSSAGP